MNAPLAIAPSKLDAILGVLGERVGVQSAMLEDLDEDDRDREDDGVGPDGIAVIPVVGALVARGLGGIEALCGLQAYGTVRGKLEAALADPRVRGILLDVDSFGGEVQGLIDLADKIRAARDVKPIYAVANENAFSAAYALASAAERLFLPRAAGVGSIGVVAAHRDRSLADRAEGVSYTFVHAGERKVDLSPHAPLGDRARAALQAEVDRLYGLFLESVAADGRMTFEEARATQAGTYHGADAVSAGLADELGTYHDALEALRERTRTSSGGHPSPFGRMPAFPRSTTDAA